MPNEISKPVFNKAQQNLGTEQVPGAVEDKSDRILVFNKGGVYLGLKLVQTFNVETGKYSDPVPRVTYIVNGKFNNIPLNGKWWREYADFVNKFADTLDGLDIERATIIDDVDRAKKLMAQFKE